MLINVGSVQIINKQTNNYSIHAGLVRNEQTHSQLIKVSPKSYETALSDVCFNQAGVGNS